MEGFTFQAHSQRHIITLSESKELVYGEYVVGTNVGLWKGVSSEFQETYSYYVNVSCDSYCDDAPENVTVLLAVVTVEINGKRVELS